MSINYFASNRVVSACELFKRDIDRLALKSLNYAINQAIFDDTWIFLNNTCLIGYNKDMNILILSYYVYIDLKLILSLLFDKNDMFLYVAYIQRGYFKPKLYLKYIIRSPIIGNCL